jgi:hypothetical protein
MAVDDARRYAIEPDGERETEKAAYHRDGMFPPRCRDTQTDPGRAGAAEKSALDQVIAGALDGHNNHIEHHKAS